MGVRWRWLWRGDASRWRIDGGTRGSRRVICRLGRQWWVMAVVTALLSNSSRGILGQGCGLSGRWDCWLDNYCRGEIVARSASLEQTHACCIGLWSLHMEWNKNWWPINIRNMANCSCSLTLAQLSSCLSWGLLILLCVSFLKKWNLPIARRFIVQ